MNDIPSAWNWAIIWPNLVTIVVTIGAFSLAYLTSVKATARMVEITQSTKLADLRTRWIEDTRVALADFDEVATKLLNLSGQPTQHETVASLFRLKTYIQLKLNLSEELHRKAMECIEQIVDQATKGAPFAKESKELGQLSNKIFKTEWNKVLVHLGEKQP